LRAAEWLPPDATTQQRIGAALVGANRAEDALRFLVAARRLEPTSLDAALGLAEGYLEAGRPDLALQTIEEIPASDRQSPAALEVHGTSLLRLGRRTEAKERFATLLRQRPNDPEAYIHATQVALEDDDWEEALRILNEGLARAPDAWLLLLRRGVTYKLMGRIEEARADLVAATAVGGDISLIAAALGDVLAAGGDLRGASGVFRKAFAETGNPVFQFAYALSLARQGDEATALGEMRKASHLLPQNARVHYEYGKLLRNIGEVLAARQQFERAHGLDPKYSPNLYALIRVYVALGEQQLATRMVEEFRSLRKNQP